jgi:hypothetical protein
VLRLRSVVLDVVQVKAEGVNRALDFDEGEEV